MSMNDIDSVGKSDAQLGCFQSASRRLLKRKHSEIEEIPAKSEKKKSIFEAIGEKLGFSRATNNRPKSILTTNTSNLLASGKLNQSYQHDYNSFDVTNNVVEQEHEVPKKRVKFDEENLIYSSITYQRQTAAYQMMNQPGLNDNTSMFSKLVNFTASLF